MTAVSEVRILAQPRTVISAAASGGTRESIHISHRDINGRVDKRNSARHCHCRRQTISSGHCTNGSTSTWATIYPLLYWPIKLE